MANAQLARQQAMVDYLELKAPYDGVVTARNIDTGHFLAGTGVKPLLAVARTDRVRVFVDVPEAEAPLVTTGDAGDPATIQVQSLAGRAFAGKVTRSGWALDASNRSLRIEMDLPNTDEVLRPGMYASVLVVLDERANTITLPIAAVTAGAEPYCYVVESGKLRKATIILGLRSGDEVEVLDGVREGEVVVLTGVGGLQDGMRCKSFRRDEVRSWHAYWWLRTKVSKTRDQAFQPTFIPVCLIDSSEAMKGPTPRSRAPAWGLGIAKAIIESHGGSIELQAFAPLPAKFCVTLPLTTMPLHPIVNRRKAI